MKNERLFEQEQLREDWATVSAYYSTSRITNELQINNLLGDIEALKEEQSALTARYVEAKGQYMQAEQRFKLAIDTASLAKEIRLAIYPPIKKERKRK